MLDMGLVKKRTLSAAVAVLAILASVVTPAAASAAKSGGTFKLSGQLTGKLVLNTTATCIAGNIEKSAGVTNVRLYLTDHGLKPTSGVWGLELAAKTQEIKFPARYPIVVALDVYKGPSLYSAWVSDTTGREATGSVSFGARYESGKIDVTLPAGLGQKGAKKPEKVVGSWACAK